MTSPPTIAVNGPAIRALRMAKGVGVTPFAERIGCHRSYIAGLETGHRHRVSPEFFAKLIVALALDDDRAIRANPYGSAVQ
jgi:transcriptional regulator with XRE-family HTH domain